MARCSRRERAEEYLNNTVELTTAVLHLTDRIADLQSEMWMEIAELKELFVDLDRLELALYDLRVRLELAAAGQEPL